MAYKALYRIYRPQTFDEVVGQKYIVKTLQNAIKNDKIAHAYLFTGPRGTGKTTVARLLAKALNCTATSGDKPCNRCANCRDITNGSHPDVIEIDAASNNGVDDARLLVENVKYAPIEGKYKIYIIDEVHMMSEKAFAALLKTIEEPPAHVIFIFATTDVQKVLGTIISRCQRFDFGKVSDADIKKKIIEILTYENAAFEEEAVNLIVELAEGGVRDAISILDQGLAYGDGKVTAQDIRDIYGVVSNKEAIDFLIDVTKKDAQTCLKKIDDFDKRGLDLARFTATLINILKDAVVYNNTTGYRGRISAEDLIDLRAAITNKTTFKYIDILMETIANYRYVPSPRSYFELAVLELCEIETQIEKGIEKPVQIREKQAEAKPVEKEIKPTEKVVVATQKSLFEETKKEAAPIERSIVDLTADKAPVEEAKEEVKVEPETAPEKPVEAPRTETSQPENSAPEKPAPIVQKSIVFDDADVMNILVQATKVDREFANGRWKIMRQYMSNPKFARAVALIIDSKVLAASPTGLVLGYIDAPQIKLAKRAENYYAIKDFLKELLNKDVVILPMHDDDFEKQRMNYINLRNLNRLPTPKPVKDPETIEVEAAGSTPFATSQGLTKESIDAHPRNIAEFGKALFGDLYKGEEDR